MTIPARPQVCWSVSAVFAAESPRDNRAAEADRELELDAVGSGSDERGASLVEYALLVALIALVCVAAVTFIGNQTADSISNIGNSLN